jgi:NAD(P)-dependent dehydrogenase (short-subunit alcohol dehydrogenase family)
VPTRPLTDCRLAADEVRGTGITVNCVVPSIIDTPANRAAGPNANHDAWPKVGDIARSYLYLAEPESGLINGPAGAPNLDAARLEMETNYFGTLSMCRAFAPVLAASGGRAIVNMLSVTSFYTNPTS